MQGVILAAGRGTRMGDMDMPKCLLKIGNLSLIQYQLSCLSQLGIDDVMIITGYNEHMIKEHLMKEHLDANTEQRLFDPSFLNHVSDGSAPKIKGFNAHRHQGQCTSHRDRGFLSKAPMVYGEPSAKVFQGRIIGCGLPRAVPGCSGLHPERSDPCGA